MEKVKIGKVLITPKGEYDPAVQYDKLDTVRYNGSTFLTLQPVMGVEPAEGEYYTLLAEKGEKGEKGATGASRKGEPGDDGVTFTPSVSETGDLSWENDGGLENPETVNIRGPKGDKGADGERGTGIIQVTTAPSEQSTTIGNTTWQYKMLLANIRSQGGVREVLIGDTIQWSHYHYVVDNYDDTYAYFLGRQSIKGDTGAQGVQGPQGEKGDKGDNGIPITITRVAEAIASGGTNTVTFSDGTELHITNGEKGDKGDKGDPGAAGADGKTPVRGTDYWTEADKTEIVNDVLAQIVNGNGVAY